MNSSLFDFNEKQIPLREIQKRAIEIAHIQSHFGFYFDTGTGKTRTACSIIKKDLSEHWGKRVWVVITPKTVIPSWIRELLLWDLPFYTLSQEYLRPKNGFDLLVGFTKKKYFAYWEQQERKILVINPELLIRKEIKDVDGVVVDESSIMQYPQSKQTRKVLEFSFSADKLYLLSANPAPNDPIYLWAQAYSVKATNARWKEWAEKYGYMDQYYRWHAHKNKIQEIMKVMGNYCWYVSKKEVLTLSDPTVIKDEFYSETKSDVALDDLATKDKKELKNILIKLRTLSSGFAYINDIENEEDLENEKYIKNIEVYDQDRLDSLSDIVDSYAGKKIIIWYQFIFSRDQIKKMLSDKNIKFTESPEEFIKKPDILVFLSHPRSCGKGVDGLQNVCSDMIFYELSFSYDEYYQSLSRLHRSGQENPVVVHILVNKGSIDEFILQAIEQKANFLDFLIEGFSR